VIPAELRRRYGIKPGTRVRFVEKDGEIMFQPVTGEYIRGLCGVLKGGTSATKELLAERKRDREKEEA
jgi:AbrB family looped-hinge helix DNA binding protein